MPSSPLKEATTNCSVSFVENSSNMNLDEDGESSTGPDEQQQSPLRRIAEEVAADDSDKPKTNTSDDLHPHPTFESNSTSDDSDEMKKSSRPLYKRQTSSSLSPRKRTQREIHESSASSSPLDDFRAVPLQSRLSQLSQHGEGKFEEGDYDDRVPNMVYIALFSVFGAVLRTYVARLFGLDCEYAADENEIDDFLTSFSRRICVTASGRTEQTGGALFTDLPSNMLGCFLVGLLTPTLQEHPLPWFKPDHPLQTHTPFITALRVGFCGSLTTFASWNTQMIVMLDGTDTELGPQVASALVGYVIGICCSISSFVIGRHVHDWLRAQHGIPDPSSSADEFAEYDEDEEDALVERIVHTGWRQATSAWEHAMEIFGIRLGPLLVFCGLLTAFLIADFSEDIPFYRRMWMTVFLAPLGALLRWKLSEWNCKEPFTRRGDWLPRGTLTANLVAAVLSVLMRSLDFRLVYGTGVRSEFVHPLLLAIETGFAGSLSTVSTMIGEMFCRENPTQAHAYYFITIFSAMILGLTVYSPIVRSG